MIKNFSISNFKSWERSGTIKTRKITGFFGTNSSGKTSLLQFLLLLKQTVETSDRSLVLNFGSETSYWEAGTMNDIIFSHDTSRELGFSIHWKLNSPFVIMDPTAPKQPLFEGKEFGFETEIRQTSKSRLYVQKLTYLLDDYQFTMERNNKIKYEYALSSHSKPGKDDYKFTKTQGRGWPLPEPMKFYGFPDQVRAYYQNAGFLSDLQLKMEEQFNALFYLGPLRDFPKRQYTWAGVQPGDMGQRGEKVVDALLVSRHREKISRGRRKKKLTVEEYVAFWLKELGLIHSFAVKSLAEGKNLYQVLVKTHPDSSEVLITEVGFGVSQILPVLTLCYYTPPGSTILFEQPEIHLHPRVQAGLADVFIDAVKVRDIQIILESHSEHLLRRLQRRIAEEDLSYDDAALYFCEKKTADSVLTELELDEYGNIQNWPDGFFGDEMSELSAMSDAIFRRKNNG